MDPIKLKADASGFLLGEVLTKDDASKALSAIKGDTSKILLAINRAMTATAMEWRRQRTDAARQAAAPAAVRKPVAVAREPAAARSAISTPRLGAAAWERPRDAKGRFTAFSATTAEVATPGPAASQTASVAAAAAAGAAKAAAALGQDAIARSVSATAQAVRAQSVEARATTGAVQRQTAAVADVARTVERQAAAESTAQRVRDSLGRFGRGKGRSGDDVGDERPTILARALARLKGIAGRGLEAAEGSENIDPALAAASEVHGFLKGAQRVLGRDRDRGDDDEKPGLTRKLLTRIAKAVEKNDKRRDELAPRAREGGGGIFDGLLNKLPSLAPVAAALTSGIGMVGGALAGMAKRLPVVGAAIEAISGVVDDAKLAADQSLTPDQRTDQRVRSAAGTVGAIGGSLLGGALGTVLGPAGTAAGAIGGAMLGRGVGNMAGDALNSPGFKAARGRLVELASSGLGAVSAFFESGKRGAGTVSTGKGDAGGASYGTHQLSSKTGTLQKFLSASGYGSQFAGLEPGSAEFNSKWRQVAAADPAFGKAQEKFITETHYAPQMERLAASGLDLTGRGRAVQEAVYSTSVQFGPQSTVVQKALAGRDVAKMSDAEIVSAVQDYKAANNDRLFRSSSAEVRASTLKRASAEKATLLAMTAAPAGIPPTVAAVTPPAPAIPRTTAAPSAVPPSPVPEPQAVAAPASPPIAQRQTVDVPRDVRDRTLAHIVTGGMSGLGPV